MTQRDGPPEVIEYTQTTPPEGAPYPVEHVNPDGTVVPRDGVRDGQRDLLPQQQPLVTGNYLDPFTALQFGMWQILDPLTFTTIDRLTLMVDGRVELNQFKLTRIFFDWPDSEDGSIPAPSVSIMAPDEIELQLPGPLSGQQLIEDTLDLYRQGYVLRRLYEMQATLQVVGWFAHKDERAGAHRGLIEAFGGEPGDERPGRRVEVAQYFDRVARYDLMGITYEDTPDNARSKVWPMTARFSADITAVALVEAPAAIREPRFRVNT